MTIFGDPTAPTNTYVLLAEAEDNVPAPRLSGRVRRTAVYVRKHWFT